MTLLLFPFNRHRLTESHSKKVSEKSAAETQEKKIGKHQETLDIYVTF